MGGPVRTLSHLRMLVSRGLMVRKSLAKPTVMDVARLAGVAPITVSRAINGTARVSSDKMKRIHAAVSRLDYRPNQAARILKGQHARIIGLIVPELSDSFFATCAAAIEQMAFERGYTTLILRSRPSDKGQVREVDTLISHNVAGIIMVPSTDISDVGRLDTRGVPIVAMDRPMLGAMTNEVSEVMVENRAGAKMAVDHLLSHGHTRIACVAQHQVHTTIRERINGYKHSMRRAGLPIEVHEKVDSLEDCRVIVEKWLHSSSPPTAVFTPNGPATRFALEAIQGASLEIPNQIALIGFDDFELTPFLKCPLTTVRQPTFEMGLRAARLLFERIDNSSPSRPKSPQKIVLPVELIIRRSCGCV
jgi:LacI family transcriptional regulator